MARKRKRKRKKKRDYAKGALGLAATGLGLVAFSRAIRTI